MRLAIVRRRFVPTGGAERFIENAIEALAETGVETTLVSESAEAAPAGGGRLARMVRIPPTGGSRYRRYRAFQAPSPGLLRRIPSTSSSRTNASWTRIFSGQGTACTPPGSTASDANAAGGGASWGSTVSTGISSRPSAGWPGGRT